MTLVGSALLGWLATPLQGGIKGYSFPLLGEVLLADGITRPVRLLSFGSVAVLLGVAAAAAGWLRWPRVTFWVGAAAVLLSVHLAGSVTLSRSEILEAVVDQNVQRSDIRAFDERSIGGVAALMYIPALDTEYLYHRLSSGLWVFGFGWQLALAAGILLEAYAFGRMGPGRRRHMAAFGVLFAVLLAVLGGRAVIGEYYLLRGDRFNGRGEFQRARELYERAREWNAQLDYNPAHRHRLGEVYSQLGILNRPETYLYRGDLYLEQGQVLQALQAFEQALAVRPDDRVARKRRVDAYVAAGLMHFKDEDPQKAIAKWEKANALDRGRVEVLFYLAKGYFDVRRSPHGIEVSEAAVARTRELLVRADSYLLAGDCYYRLRDFVSARQMYQLSLDQDPRVTNLLDWPARFRLQGI